MSNYHLSKTDLARIDEFTEKCVDCGLCMRGCPMADVLNGHPGSFMRSISENKVMPSEIAFNCTLCGYCYQVCPREADLAGLMSQLRKSTCNELSGIMRLRFNMGVLFQKASFSHLLTTDVMFKDKNNRGKSLFFPGCALSAANPDMVLSIWSYLRSIDQGTGIMLQCCGAPTEAMGDDDKFHGYWARVKRDIRRSGVTEIILVCPNCMRTITDLPPEVTTTSIWEVIDREGLPQKLKGKYRGKSLWLHDPCTTRANDNLHRSIREVIDFLGFRTMEFTHNREKALCCGRGGMVGLLHPKRCSDWSGHVKQEAHGDIVSYCRCCVDALGPDTSHLLSFIFGERQNETRSMPGRWINRLKLKKEVMS